MAKLPKGKPALEYNPAVTRTNSPETLKALVDALRFDPFYVAISQEFADDEERRREALARYFDYSMSEGERRGRLVAGDAFRARRRGRG